MVFFYSVYSPWDLYKLGVSLFILSQWKQWETLFWAGSKNTADGDCNHEIKRCLLFGRKAMSNSHNHTWLLDKPQLWLGGPLSPKYVSPFNMMSRFVTALLPKSKHLLISWLQSPSAVILEHKNKKNKFCHCFHCIPIYLPWRDRTRCHDLSFLNVEF